MSTVPEATTQTAAEILAGAQTLSAAFQATAARRGDAVALRTPGGDVSISWSEYARKVRAVAAGLAAHGVGRGDTVAMMLTNSPEAHIVDSAALHLGATPFSVYNTFAPEQIEYVVTNSGARVLVIEAQFADKIPALEHVSVITDDLDQLVAAGDPGFDFEAAWRAVGPNDVATLIYTSGTTGPPKGVELTHSNLVWTTRAWMDVTEMLCDGSLMSYLPMAHLADRVF